MNYENIIVGRQDAVGTITLNRPQQLNALNKATISELSHAFETFDADRSIRAIVLHGAGEKAFGAGADVKEFAHFAEAEGRRLSAEGHRILFNKVENLGTPVIAAIHGYALGGGLELALACHMRIAAEGSKMGLPEVTLGVIPGYGGTQRLTALVGKGRAMEMILSAAMVDAGEALRIGLINKVVTPDQLLAAAIELAARIAKNSPMAVRTAIAAINAYNKHGVDGLAAEVELFGSLFGTADFIEGTTAFLEKRKPAFQG
jgi:enoyl-CoA hydratase